jgi:hypothetical protein
MLRCRVARLAPSGRCPLVDPPADLNLYMVADARVLIFHQRARDHLDTGYPCRARCGCRITRRSGGVASSERKGPTMRHDGNGCDAGHHIALEVRVDATWWAAIGAFVSIRTTDPASMQRGALRIIATATGAVIGLLLTSWLIEDQVALSPVLLVVSTLGVL